MTASLSEVATIVRDLLHDNTIELDDQTRFDDVIGWDSMDLVTVVVEVECRHNLMFDVQEIDGLVTAGDLARMIETKRALAA